MEAAVHTKPMLVCVDDEPNVLEGLALNLRRRFDVRTAPGGAEGLALLDEIGTPAVIISDMRMPGMNGAAFLAEARRRAPDSVRMLLTGQTDLGAAISAVNEGQIFRFLTKPCPPPQLLDAAQAAAEQHRLLRLEKDLLEKTLLGSVKAMTDILSISSPALFGRAGRIRKLCSALRDAMGREKRWQLDVAAMLSQIGWVALPAEVAEKLNAGRGLTEREQTMVENARALSARLIGHIPRLDAVVVLLDGMRRPWSALNREVLESDPQGAFDAQLLRAATDFDAYEASGRPAKQSLLIMRGLRGSYDPEILDAIEVLRVGERPAQGEVRELRLGQLEPGMVFEQDVLLKNGVLLASRGYEITDGFLERISNFRDAIDGKAFKVSGVPA